MSLGTPARLTDAPDNSGALDVHSGDLGERYPYEGLQRCNGAGRHWRISLTRPATRRETLLGCQRAVQGAGLPTRCRCEPS